MVGEASFHFLNYPRFKGTTFMEVGHLTWRSIVARPNIPHPALADFKAVNNRETGRTGTLDDTAAQIIHLAENDANTDVDAVKLIVASLSVPEFCDVLSKPRHL